MIVKHCYSFIDKNISGPTNLYLQHEGFQYCNEYKSDDDKEGAWNKTLNLYSPIICGQAHCLGDIARQRLILTINSFQLVYHNIHRISKTRRPQTQLRKIENLNFAIACATNL